MSQGTAGRPSTTPPPWEVVITEWALSSYLELKRDQTFTDTEYRTMLRPDVRLLRDGIPSPHAQFRQSTFWGPAKQGSAVLPHGHKMKWRNLGPGRVQLRLPVMAGSATAFLCEAYVKSSVSVDQRKMARFKTHMNLISRGRYVHRGSL
jgi:hypothetical protein